MSLNKFHRINFKLNHREIVGLKIENHRQWRFVDIFP